MAKTPKIPKDTEQVTPLKLEVREMPQLVQHPNTKSGLLYAGGVPGNAGGTGRPPSAVRHAARESFASRINVLEEIADGATTIELREQCPSCGYESPEKVRIPLKTAAADKVKALDLLGRVGIPQQREYVLPEVRERVVHTAQVLREELNADDYERIATRLSVVWGGYGQE